jgi:hypothetical protein
VWRTPFPSEMAEWSPTARGAQDDALDALAGCLLAEPVRLPGVVAPVRGVRWRGGV